MSKIFVYNESEKLLILSQKTHLSKIVKYKADKYYSAHSDTLSLTAQKNTLKDNINWAQQRFYIILTLITAFNVITEGLFKETFITSLKVQSEIFLLNKITIYENTEALNSITEVTKQYSQLWENWDNIINISESEWMNILFLNN